MRIIVVEDEPIFANAIERIIDELGYDLVGMTDNSEEMLRFFMSLQPDLALMDIHIKGSMTGIEVAKKIANSNYSIPIIFITSYAEKHIFDQAKEANPYAYIVKPIDEKLLQRTIELAVMRYAQPNHSEDKQVWKNDILVRKSLFVKTDNKLQKVEIEDILFIEVIDKYCEVQTYKEKYLVRMTLKEIEERLPASDFVQIHRSTIVNANFIDNIDLKDNFLTLNERQFEISKRFRPNLLSRLNTFK
jgi:DNA-binding LytR/AlgR family response regulator